MNARTRLERLAVDASRPDVDLSLLARTDWLIVKEARRLASLVGTAVSIEMIRQAKATVETK